jgi:hypothetical protein
VSATTTSAITSRRSLTRCARSPHRALSTNPECAQQILDTLAADGLPDPLRSVVRPFPPGVVGRGCGAGRRAVDLGRVSAPRGRAELTPPGPRHRACRRTVYLRFSGALQLHPPRGQLNLRGGPPVYLEVSGCYEVANQNTSHPGQ